MNQSPLVVQYDARWETQQGIGRFARELRSRLPGLITGNFSGKPTSPSTVCAWVASSGISDLLSFRLDTTTTYLTAGTYRSIRIYNSRFDLCELSGGSFVGQASVLSISSTSGGSQGLQNTNRVGVLQARDHALGWSARATR